MDAPRRNRPARSRREQALRAEARTVSRFLRGMALLMTHRGSQPSVIGGAVASALRVAKEKAEEAQSADEAADAAMAGQAKSAANAKAAVEATPRTPRTEALRRLSCKPVSGGVGNELAERFKRMRARGGATECDGEAEPSHGARPLLQPVHEETVAAEEARSVQAMAAADAKTAVEAMSEAANSNEARLAGMQRELEAARFAATSARQELLDGQDKAECRVEALVEAALVLQARVQELEDELEVQHSALAQADADLASCLTTHRAELTEERAKFEGELEKAACRMDAMVGAALEFQARVQELEDELEVQRSALAQADADLESSLTTHRAELTEERAKFEGELEKAACRMDAMVGAAMDFQARVQELEDELEVQRSALAQADADLVASRATHRAEPAEEAVRP